MTEYIDNESLSDINKIYKSIKQHYFRYLIYNPFFCLIFTLIIKQR